MLGLYDRQARSPSPSRLKALDPSSILEAASSQINRKVADSCVFVSAVLALLHRGVDAEYFIAWIDERVHRLRDSSLRNPRAEKVMHAAQVGSAIAPQKKAREVFKALLRDG